MMMTTENPKVHLSSSQMCGCFLHSVYHNTVVLIKPLGHCNAEVGRLVQIRDRHTEKGRDGETVTNLHW